ncbi:unnamed protein product [Rhizophagus irregularis]|nr:unnamed protein product [Rhizophagus irregularis]
MFFGTRQTSPTEYSLFYGRSRRVSSKDKKYEVQRGLESCSQPGRHITTRRFGPRDANGRFGSVSVLKPWFSAETELTAKPTDKTELQNRSQNYCKIE